MDLELITSYSYFDIAHRRKLAGLEPPEKFGAFGQ